MRAGHWGRLGHRLADICRRLLLRPPPPLAAGRAPAVPVEDSVTPNFLICLETGTRQVTLRRHLHQTLNMTPEEYRARWGLPADYPMVADSYDSRRKSVQIMAQAKER